MEARESSEGVMTMKSCTYAILVLNAFLWFMHWEVGFSHAVALCHNGKCLCTLFVIKVACELIGLLYSLILFRCVHKSWATVSLSIFVLSLAIDIGIRYLSNREDDVSPKAMIILSGGFTVEEPQS